MNKWLGLGGALVAVLITAWFVWPVEVEKTGDAARIRQADCNPVGHPCQVRLGDVILTLTLPAKVRAMQAFDMELRVQGVDPVEHAVIEMNMAEMDMGRNRFVLKPTPGQGKTWRGTAMLPACMSGRSDWLAEVTVVSGKRQYQARFSFALEP